MRPAHPTRALTVLVVVLSVLTVVNLGASGIWWLRTAGSGATAAHASPSATASATAAAPSASATATGPSASVDGIPAQEAPGTSAAPATVDLAASWKPPTDMPTAGRLLRVDIPGTTSHFRARDALLWLPPAALTADPPSLPVVVLMSGQSKGAGPEDLASAGHIEETMDALATLHEGLAPIVVVPDQLGPDSGNPMCVDGPLGNSRTYLEDDVPAWITSHLRVQTAPSAWTVGGFSQGGTCAIQLGAGDPGRFGNLIDVSGEDGPTLGSTATTIAKGFSGNAAAFRQAQPAALMAAHAPYRATNAFFAAGGDDHSAAPVMPVQAQRARTAGMHVTTWVLPGAGHSWGTAAPAIAAGLTWLVPLVHLSPS
ncbi:esterase family protein [Curtobacterium sp. 9128]|uniref:alpha/beta hydrolase n=1 Tax=Curtobacterium sp. 9128 TaxID=1793722 RepID=UPI0011AA813A|nr:alpha/beta hydrolase-fold protein [Curtobacterium sp. 9128]